MSFTWVVSSVRAVERENSTTSLTAAEDGDTAVELYDRCGRGICGRGAGLDEYDGLARLGAAGARARARNVPDSILFSFRDAATVATSPSWQLAAGTTRVERLASTS